MIFMQKAGQRHGGEVTYGVAVITAELQLFRMEGQDLTQEWVVRVAFTHARRITVRYAHRELPCHLLA